MKVASDGMRFVKTVSATEAKNRLGALIGEVAGGKGAEASARNADLSPEEAEAIADELADEAMARVVARARLRWA